MSTRCIKPVCQTGEDHASFLRRFRLKVTPNDLKRLDLAYDVAKYGHRNQLRESGERYFEHVRSTAIILVDELGVYDVELIMAALLHDILEDSFLLKGERAEMVFGSRVARITKAVTKVSKDDPRFATNQQRIDSQVYCGCSTLSPESRIFLDGMCDKIKSLLIKLNESSATDFCLWDQVAKYFEDFSFMKHVFFEAINEYLYIKQDNDEALKFAKMGEVYAKNVKNYLFSVSPILKKKFSTEVFETNLRIHIDRLKKEGQKIIKHYDSEDFMQFMQARLFTYLSTMLNEVNHESITGRFVLKNTSSEKRHTVEQCGAEKIWRKADNFSVLHYRAIPKGEWGIMPVSNNIKTYQGQYVDGFIQNIQPIKIKIESRILNNTESVLRIKI